MHRMTRDEKKPQEDSLSISRRTFLGFAAGAACATSLLPRARAAEADGTEASAKLDFPLMDLHVHLDGSTLEKVLEISKQRGIEFGIVEHAGTKENKYPVVLSSDAELKGHMARLEGKPACKGIQAEWTDWMGCFSREVLSQLDFVLTDTMTFPGKDGRRVKLWEDTEPIGDRETFMDRYVDWHVEILEKEPLDILGNTSWLPAPLAPDYEKFWTPKRMAKVFDAALKHQVALEISSSFKLPKLHFLKAAKEAGVKFCFGSNGRYPNMGKLDYSVEMAKVLGLRKSDIFVPAPPGQRAADRRGPGRQPQAK
jgi:histidinol phosphatase-like PHP family hydrolase